MKKVIVLLGPTGVGKTSASILLAKELHSEIISADSMQIYRHMDIGTAKPTPEEQAAVPHHMIDVVEPWEAYSTGEYIEAVQPIFERLFKEQKIPVVVGGTGLYIRAMTRGIFKGPSADWELRTTLLEREELAPGSLYEELKSLDPEAATKIMPADTRRIVRALEVCLKSDASLSALHKALTQPLPYDFVKIGITRDRKELYRMIDERVDLMLKQGLIEEVKRVMEMIEKRSKRQEGYRKDECSPMADCPSPIAYSSMQAIGYKEIALHLAGELNLEDAITLVKKRSRNYAKRQFTWFRKEPGIQWVDVTGVFGAQEVFKKVLQLIEDE